MPALLLQLPVRPEGIVFSVERAAPRSSFGTPHDLEKTGWGSRRELSVAFAADSRRIRDGQTQCKSRTRAFRGEMAIIYRYVASVYHHVHLGPRYASASCQVFLSSSLSTSMAPWTGLDWTGIFGWTLPLDSSLNLDLDLECPRSRIVLSLLEDIIAHRLPRAPSHLLHFRRVFRRHIVPGASRSSSHCHEAWMTPPNLGQLHGFGDACHCGDSSFVPSAPVEFACYTEAKAEAEESRARSCSRVWGHNCHVSSLRLYCCCACRRCRKRGLSECRLGGPVLSTVEANCSVIVVAADCPLEFLVRDVLADDRVTAQVFQLMVDRDLVHNTWCGEGGSVGGLLGGLLGSGSVTRRSCELLLLGTAAHVGSPAALHTTMILKS